MAFLVSLGAVSLRPQEEKLPVPSSSEARKAEKVIRGLFPNEYKAKGRGARRDFARKLLEQAEESQGNPVSRFVLLREARDIASGALGVKTALAAVAKMVELYAVDSEKTYAPVLSAVRRELRTPAEAAAVAGLYYDVVSLSIRSENYDVALKFAREVERLARTARTARTAKDTSLMADARARAKEIPDLKREADQAAQVDLSAAIDLGAGKSNLTVGRYLCFVKGEWEKGLEYLLYAGNPLLEKIAEQELKKPTGAEGQVSLAEDWLALSEKERNALHKKRYQERAFTWFEAAREVSKGLARVRIDQRLRELMRKGLRSWRTTFGKGIVGAWNLDEGRGTKAADRSGRGNQGILRNISSSSGWQSGDSFAESVLRFDGVDDYIKIEGDSVWNTLDQTLTLAAWICKDRDQAGAKSVVSRQLLDGTKDRFFLGFLDNKLLGVVETEDGLQGVLETVKFPNEKWSHIALTYDGSVLRLYQDGKEVKANPTVSGKLGDEMNPVIIGGSENTAGDAAQENFAGRIARVRIYDRALSASELSKLMDGDR